MSLTSFHKESRCLFVQYTAEYGGSPISGLTIVEALRARKFEVDVVFGVPGILEQEYKTRGFNVYYLPHGQWLLGGKFLRHFGRWRWEILAAYKFFRLMRRIKPRIVYVNTLMSVAAVFAACLQRIPVIWHIRELLQDANGEMQTPFGGRFLVKVFVRKLPSAVVCISKAVQYNIVGLSPCPKCRIMYNSLDNSYFAQPLSKKEAREELGIKENDFVVGIPGNLRPVKGHIFFLDAALQIIKKKQDYRFIISGSYDQPYGFELLKRSRSLGLYNHVKFVGGVKDMRIFYTACDVICVPSRGEPFGRTVIEAFAKKRPVIATRTGGIPEVITEKETGLIVDYGDVNGLCNAIYRLYHEPVLYEHLTDHAFIAANEHYHENVFNRQFNDLIDSVERC